MFAEGVGMILEVIKSKSHRIIKTSQTWIDIYHASSGYWFVTYLNKPFEQYQYNSIHSAFMGVRASL